MKHAAKLAAFTAVLFLQACWPILDEVDDISISSEYEPVYLARTTLENSVVLKGPKPILSSGKIYIKDNLLFINEVRKGFHIFDNSNPQKPVKIKFIEAPGCTDLAIRENAVYINQATDLIAIRLDFNLTSISVTKRIKNTFPQLVSPDGFYADDIPENSIVVDWKLRTEE